jgi:chemotaxis protein histidine kinase CheA
MDPELYELFAEELNERSAVLAEGARAIEAGEIDGIDAEEMRREGHTIKGNGRVMGYDLIGTAGQVCEEVWGWIERREVDAGPALGAALHRLAEAIPAAIDQESADLIPAIRGVHTALEGEWLPGELPVV